MDPGWVSGAGDPASSFEDVEIGDLTDVKEEKSLIPPTSGVKLVIKSAKNRSNESGSWRSVALQLKIVDGIDEEGKYRNMSFFTDVPYYADKGTYDFNKPFFAKKQYLVQLRHLLSACGFDIATTKVTEGLMADLTVKEVVANIIIEKGTDGYDDKNIAKNFKAVQGLI